MKKYTFILIAFMFSGNISAQSFEWAKRCGSYAFDLGYGVGTDNAGNVYIAGKYEMNAYFGGTYVKCAGNHDIYIAKYNSAGVFQWVRTAGGSIGDYAWAIVVDGAGNSYITGEFETTTRFGAVTLVSTGNNDVFVAKYDTNGNLIFAKKLGASGANDRGLGISLSGGSLYITGRFQGTAYFSGTPIVCQGAIDIFVAKITTAGVFQWVRRAGGSGEDEGLAVSNDPSGNVYVTGYFNGTANFNGTYITTRGGTDVFIAKYSPDGALLWVKKTGGTANDVGNAIKVDNAGRVFVTGGFRYNSLFGAISLNAQGGNADIFIARYDASGNCIWAKKAGAGDNDSGRGIAADAGGNTYITGNCGRTATFGSTTVNGPDYYEIFFASYDVNGNFRWVLKAGGAADASDPDRFIEMGLSIATDLFGNVYASGAYRSNSTFGATTLPGLNNHTEIYVTKIKQGGGAKMAGGRASIMPSESASFCTGGSLTLKTNEDPSAVYQWMKNDVAIKDATGASYKANTPGNYRLQIINGSDTLLSEPTNVSAANSIVAVINSERPADCKDSSTTLIANAGEDYIYQWKRNDSIIAGATSHTYHAKRTGDYQVKIIQGSCFNWSPIKNVTVEFCKDLAEDATGIASLQAKSDSVLILIYPNPNNGLFTLDMNMANSGQHAGKAIIIEVVNALGQVIYTRSVSFNDQNISEHIELDSSVPQGIYFLQVINGDKVEKTRLMLLK